MIVTPLLNAAARAANQAALALTVRDVAIRQAAKTHTIREIATAVGLSPSRVHQIIHGR